MNFASTIEFNPKCDTWVTVKLRRIGPRKRAEIEMSISDARARQRSLTSDYFAAKEALDKLLVAAEKNEDGTPKDVTPAMGECALKVAGAANAIGLLLNAEIRPAYLEAGVMAILGSAAEGAPELTVSDLCDSGPDELFLELSDMLIDGSALSGDLSKNSESPITSPAVGDGAMSSTTAGSADNADSGYIATAASSPSTP